SAAQAPAARPRPSRRTKPPRRVLKQEALPIDLGTSAAPRKKGGRRPLTETRDEIIHRLMDPVLTLHEAAAILNLSKATVRRYTEQGKLSCQRTAGGQRRFRLSDIMALMETPPTSSSPFSPDNGRRMRKGG
ncbi:MAG: MerR family transcriptional regulator, partial [bacterium]